MSRTGVRAYTGTAGSATGRRGPFKSGLVLRFPIGALIGSPGPQLSALERRMVDPVVRDIDIHVRDFRTRESHDLLNPKTDAPIDELFFLVAGGTGDGTEKK